MLRTSYLALVADDSEDEQILISRFLKCVPNVRLIGNVEDGDEAMSYLRGTGRFGDRKMFPYPDLLLLDYQMPRLNGLEVMALLREEEIRLQIILWSNALELVDVELARHLGASVVCQKPMNGRETAAIVNQLERYSPEPATAPLSFVLSSAYALRA